MLEVLSQPKRILGSSPQIQALQKLVRQAALTESPVFIYGERGSGREFVAEILHQSSPRNMERFEKLSCVGWSEALLESELVNRLQRTQAGTLFLDDVHEIPPRILSMAIGVGARIIAACDARLDSHGYGTQFGIRITLPALRDRKLDIPILVDHFIERYVTEFEKPVKGIHPAALRKLIAYQWPGNVRELKNAIERAVLLASSEMLDLADFSFLAIEEDDRPFHFKIPGATIREIEKEAIIRTLEHVGGSTTMAAKILDMSVRKIQYKLKEYKQGQDSEKAQRAHA